MPFQMAVGVVEVAGQACLVLAEEAAAVAALH